MLTKTQTKNWYYEDVVLLVWLVVRYCFMKLTDFRKLVLISSVLSRNQTLRRRIRIGLSSPR